MQRLLRPRLVGIRGVVEGSFYELPDDPIVIGRDVASTLPLSDLSVSRRHCSIRKLAENTFEIRDLDSHNGTAVNGLPITERVLQEGDQIRIGGCYFLFLLADRGEHSSRWTAPFEELDVQTVAGSGSSTEPSPEPLPADDPASSAGATGLEALMEISATLNKAGGAEEIAWRLLDRALHAVPAQRGLLMLFEFDREAPSFLCGWDRNQRTNVSIDPEREVVERVFRAGSAVLTDDAQGKRTRHVLAAPIRSQGSLLGLIYLEGAEGGNPFGAGHLQWIATIGDLAGLPLQHARRLEWLQAENQRLQETINLEHDLVGAAPRMKEVFQFVSKVAPADSTVLIGGESGTGKELVARAIHRNSRRANQPFVAINCAALTDTLLESELFGHERGAFTGAMLQRIGKIESANHGTLFLDEVGELPLSFQIKLLRVLQEREFERVGGNRPIRVDLRLIAATNRDLEQAIASGAFRSDLYYRLNVVSIVLPPLRERREDIPLLARHFVGKYAKRSSRRVAGLSPEAIRCLEEYDWPGNVRELENALERAIVMGSTELVLPEDLPDAILEVGRANSRTAGDYFRTVQEEKKRAILAALEQSGGNYTTAAKLLGIHPNYLHRLVRNFNLRGEIRKAGGG